MKKKILALIMGISMMAAITGCGSDKDSNNGGEISNDSIVISQYKGLEVEAVEAAAVTDEEIEASIQYTLQVTAGQYGIKDRAAENGDTVIIDYVGKKDGVAFDGGTASDYALELGSGTFIPGFEEKIVGHKPGETFDIDVTFPEEYQSEDLAGQPVVFTITFDAIVPTELTDALATAIVGKETTVEEYKQIVKADLEVSNAETAEASFENAVWEAVIKNSEMKKYDEEELASWVSIMEESYGMYASFYGMETDEYLSTYYGVTVEELAKEQMCWENAVSLIAEKENLTVSLEEYEERLNTIATQYGYEDPAEYETAYEEAYGENGLADFFLQEKVMEWLVDNSVEVKATEE